MNFFDVEQILPNDLSRFINLFTDPSNSSLPWDAEFERELIALQTKRSLRYRQSTAIKAVKEKNWFVANFHLPWLIEHEPNNPRWQALLEETNATEGKLELQDGSFESPLEDSWQVFAYMNAFELAETSETSSTQGKESLHVKASTDPGSDIQCFQTLTLQPNTTYRLSGMVKTMDVAIAQKGGTTGAILYVEEIGSSDSVIGTTEWTKLSYEFNTNDRTQVRIGARLGHNGSTCTGEAWFDDLQLEKVGVVAPSTNPTSSQ